MKPTKPTTGWEQLVRDATSKKYSKIVNTGKNGSGMSETGLRLQKEVKRIMTAKPKTGKTTTTTVGK
jgi:hypothetical protein